MDFLVIALSIVFIGLIGMAVFLLLKDTQQKSPAQAEKGKTAKPAETDLAVKLQKKLAAGEEKIRGLEEALKNTETRLQEALEREKTLLKGRSQTAFDIVGHEKIKKEYEASRQEIKHKEKTLEEEISTRRRQTIELQEAQRERDLLRKKSADTEMTLRKSQAAVEKLTGELRAAQKTMSNQEKTIKEHTENKIGGEWVSRHEFEKIEKEIAEKEALIQKILALKPQSGPKEGE